jgi:quercetin dioxygenase-like cupin family protein
VVPCPDLDAALTDVVDAGFRVHSLGPADDPRWAVVFSRHPDAPAVLRLDVGAYRRGHRRPYLAVQPGHDIAAVDWLHGSVVVDDQADGWPGPDRIRPSPVFNDSDDAGSVVGRAGLRYRDLLPGRWNGEFIASHIHIPTGGPVPDYVHYHDVDFQLIFCHRGWVRVVYEDQGEPFVLHPGDAVLQAPGIRHRVLESSDDLYVVEVSSPAEHPTYVEQQLDLPNGSRRGRRYGSQHYVHFVFDRAPQEQIGQMMVRSLGLEAATDNRYGARVIEATQAPVRPPALNAADFGLLVVLDGTATVAVDGTATGAEGRELGVGQAVAVGPEHTSSLTVATEIDPPARLLVVQRYRR